MQKFDIFFSQSLKDQISVVSRVLSRDSHNAAFLLFFQSAAADARLPHAEIDPRTGD